MQEKVKGLLAFAIYVIIIIIIHYIFENNGIILLFTYGPYSLGGCGILSFFAGRVIQEIGDIKMFLGRLCYVVLLFFFSFFACYLQCNHFGYSWSIGEALRPDTYTIVVFTVIGFLIGEIYQYRKYKCE